MTNTFSLQQQLVKKTHHFKVLHKSGYFSQNSEILIYSFLFQINLLSSHLALVFWPPAHLFPQHSLPVRVWHLSVFGHLGAFTMVCLRCATDRKVNTHQFHNIMSLCTLGCISLPEYCFFDCFNRVNVFSQGSSITKQFTVPCKIPLPWKECIDVFFGSE